MKKTVTLLLVFAVCFGLLAGCGTGEENPAVREDITSRTESSVSGEPVRYRAQFSAVTDGSLTSALQNAVVCGDELFCTALGVLEDRTPEGATPEWKEQYWVYGPILCRLSADGSVERVNYIPESEVSEKERASIVFDRLQAEQKLDVTLTDHYSIQPSTSVCGLLIWHPEAKYFPVGRIDRDQLRDYCQRRGISEEEGENLLSKFIV